ncbi:hypothetical protein NC651_033541 [Populus alba x Populus x berolinensis]|nr:hypothetical protein NC651_033541 [Populus alba x Populus x berolinensis]
MADAASLFPNQVMIDMDPTVQSDTVLVGPSFVLSSDRLSAATFQSGKNNLDTLSVVGRLGIG